MNKLQDQTKDSYQDQIQEIARYRLRRLWTAAGIVPFVILYMIFLVMMNTGNVAQTNIRQFTYVGLGLILSFQFLFVMPYMGKLAKMTQAYPHWKEDLREKVTLSSMEVLKYFLPGIGASLILVIAFVNFYQPNSRPKTTDDYQVPRHSVSYDPHSSEKEDMLDDLHSSSESSEASQSASE
ncbi:hypothetical protein ACVR0S_09470 [Streptococcus dentapri]|uniref:Uncharacterized protein n=1 Tax=Streptococcus dentapri TaxID=573564 RepID=A0ABV8D1Q9_9STRE